MRGTFEYDNARGSAGVIRLEFRLSGLSALIVPGCDARNIRPIKTDIGQFAIAKLGQFGNVALIVAECLDHADEREQHGSLLVLRFSSWRRASSLQMNIRQDMGVQKALCCGAANLKSHGYRKRRLTLQQAARDVTTKWRRSVQIS